MLDAKQFGKHAAAVLHTFVLALLLLIAPGFWSSTNNSPYFLLGYASLFILSWIFRSRIGFLVTAFYGLLLASIYFYLSGYLAEPFFSFFPISVETIIATLMASIFFVMMVEHSKFERMFSIGSCGIGVLSGYLLLLLTLIFTSGIMGLAFASFLFFTIIPLIFMTIPGLIVGYLGGLGFRSFLLDNNSDVFSVKNPKNGIFIFSLVLIALVTLLSAYPELKDLNYDGVYGTKQVRAEAENLQHQLNKIYLSQKAPYKSPLKTILDDGEWKKLCDVGGYGSFGDLGLKEKFRNNFVDRHWRYNEEHEYSFFVIRDGTIIPMKNGLQIGNNGNNEKFCVDKRQSFNLLYSEPLKDKEINFTYKGQN